MCEMLEGVKPSVTLLEDNVCYTEPNEVSFTQTIFMSGSWGAVSPRLLFDFLQVTLVCWL